MDPSGRPGRSGGAALVQPRLPDLSIPWPGDIGEGRHPRRQRRLQPDRDARRVPDAEAFERYLGRIRDPESADWSNVSPYHDRVNYGPLVYRGDAVWINASPYRSPRISAEPDNQRLVRLLPTSAFIRRWLIDVVVPLAARGERLIVVKRPGLWRLPREVRTAMGVIVDPAPIS